MSQSRRHSFEEATVSTAVGLIISTFLNYAVVPLVLHTQVSAAQNVTLTAIFTVASILRGYFIRRHYNGK